MRRFREAIVAWKSNKCYIFICVGVRECVRACGCPGACAFTSACVRVALVKHKIYMCVLIFSTILSKKFLILRRI
jgi:hypothetical protein